MKKFINMVIIMIIFFALAFSVNSYAASELSSFNIDIDKTTVKPGENVTLTVNFGAELGAYTITIDYDDDLLDVVSIDGGAKNDLDGKIKVVYPNELKSEIEARSSMSVTFKAKDVVTSNPTEFSVTAEGMSAKDPGTTYNNISKEHVKEIIVEPDYKAYLLDLKYEGTIIPGQEKDMIISYSSAMGKNYAKARLLAEATMPEGATIKLVGTHTDGTEYDIIKTGWGDPQGYEIGGKNIAQNLNFKGTFSKEGQYSITLKLIDRANSDKIIAQKTFNFTVGQTNTQVQPQKTPTELPKTGINIYVPIAFVILALIVIFVYYNKTDKKSH